jgi:hypothetical protein
MIVTEALVGTLIGDADPWLVDLALSWSPLLPLLFLAFWLHFPAAFLPASTCIHPRGRFSNSLPPGQGEIDGCANSMA